MVPDAAPCYDSAVHSRSAHSFEVCRANTVPYPDHPCECQAHLVSPDVSNLHNQQILSVRVFASDGSDEDLLP